MVLFCYLFKTFFDNIFLQRSTKLYNKKHSEQIEKTKRFYIQKYLNIKLNNKSMKLKTIKNVHLNKGARKNH